MKSKPFLPVPMAIPVPNMTDTRPLTPTPIPSSCPFPTITPQTLVLWLSDPSSHPYDQVYVIDVRFDYEHTNGRIVGAINFLTLEDLRLFYEAHLGENIALVFHCEYSHDRGPTMMTKFREYDREQNIRNYPHLNYPNMFLLSGGFRFFYQQYQDSRWIEGNYTPMRAEPYRSNGQLRHSFSYFEREIKSPRGRIRRCFSAGTYSPLSFSQLNHPSSLPITASRFSLSQD